MKTIAPAGTATAAGVVGVARLPHDREGRRVEAQRLLHDRTGIDEARQGFGGVVRAEIECRQLPPPAVCWTAGAVATRQSDQNSASPVVS